MGLQHVLYGLADTVQVWAPAAIFVLFALFIALLGYIFDSFRD